MTVASAPGPASCAVTSKLVAIEAGLRWISSARCDMSTTDLSRRTSAMFTPRQRKVFCDTGGELVPAGA